MTIAYTAVTGTTSPLLKTGIEYGVEILESSMKQDYGTNSSSVSAICTCSYEDSDLFLAEMLGYSKKIGTIGAGAYIQRMLPERSGWDFGNTGVIHYAMDAKLIKSLTYQDNDAFYGWPIYAEMVYLVTFAAPLYEVKEDEEVTWEHERFVVWSERGQSSNEKIPGYSFFLPAAGAYLAKPLGEVGVKVGGIATLSAKWLDIPAVNRSLLKTLAGKVNESVVRFDGVDYEAETVLFESWNVDKRVNSFGALVRDLTLNFQVRNDDRTWNKVRTSYASPNDLLVPTRNNDGVTKLFEADDLNQCFNIGG